MEPEKLGLLDAIEKACKNPRKVSTLIARITDKIDRHEVLRKKRSGQPMNLQDMKALAKPKLVGKELAILRLMVQNLIQAHTE